MCGACSAALKGSKMGEQMLGTALSTLVSGGLLLALVLGWQWVAKRLKRKPRDPD